MEEAILGICQAGEILEGPPHLSFSTRSQAANFQDKLIYYISQDPTVKSSNLNSPRQLPSGLKEVNMMANFPTIVCQKQKCGSSHSTGRIYKTDTHWLHLSLGGFLIGKREIRMGPCQENKSRCKSLGKALAPQTVGSFLMLRHFRGTM